MDDRHEIQARLERDVRTLCRVPRPAESAALEEARRFVIGSLVEAGWVVERSPFTVMAASGLRLNGVNLIATHPLLSRGGGPRLCVGAHLDSRPETPGADDNASAVAALLEIARRLPERVERPPVVPIELVAFDLEENGMLGGEAHARRCAATEVELVGMISLEMLGYCDPRPGSQTLLPELAGRYPSTGDFIGVVGNQRSQRFVERWSAAMRKAEGLPVETLLVPGNGEALPATRLSDHSPFWDAGFAAAMVTDTSFLRNPHYHQPSDAPETLDYAFLERVTAGCLAACAAVVAGAE